MIIDIEYLYQRFNGFINGDYPIKSANTLIRILNEGTDTPEEVDRKIIEYELKDILLKGDLTELKLDKDFIQPKSIFVKILYLELLLYSIPTFFYEHIELDSDIIMQISISIILYYISLQTMKNGTKKTTESQNRYLFNRTDYIIGINEINKVCGYVTQEMFDKYTEFYAARIEEIEKNSEEKLYLLEDKSVFVLSVDDFAEYVVLKTEKLFRKISTERGISECNRKKGFGFEDIVYSTLKCFVEEIYHTLHILKMRRV